MAGRPVEVRGEDFEDEALALTVLPRRTVEAVRVGARRRELVVEEAHRESLAAVGLTNATHPSGAVGVRRAGFTIEVAAEAGEGIRDVVADLDPAHARAVAAVGADDHVGVLRRTRHRAEVHPRGEAGL